MAVSFSQPARRCQTSPRKASGIPPRTRAANCRGRCLGFVQRASTSAQDSSSISEQSFDTSPVPLSRGSSPS
jgi:hypothetical protein